ncbi:hypothetical protein PsorP6_015491 [Peronosclerospora sorghi]|uniref:Uncharacterized protein n=1 Tax=Peronosclerospora sorghi TaxID=230839 RepID=A0ACC0WQ63_9STRA|nr:hypothetical protein PsorP6_015491 [Peronosclerospora sorghi]
MEFKEGDLVLLSAENLNIRHQTTLKTMSTSKKFIPKWIVPYKIIKNKSDNVVQLELPPHMKLHLTINIDKLKPYPGNPDKFKTREIPKSTPIIFYEEGERLYIIERLVKKRVRHGHAEYLVK